MRTIDQARPAISGQMKISPAVGRVSRIVPGRLVYVEIDGDQRVVSLKPDNLALRQPDGTLRRYRGEPFDEIGVIVGNAVEFVLDESTDRDVVVVMPGTRPNLFNRLKYFTPA